VIGSLIGSLGVFALLKGTALAIFFALFVGFSATQMFLDKKPKPTRQMPGTGRAARRRRRDRLHLGPGRRGRRLHQRALHDLVQHRDPQRGGDQRGAGFPIAVANVAGYVVSGHNVQGLPAGAFGYIWLPALVVIAACSVFTAPLGAKAAHSLPVKKLKRVFASILYLLAAYMLWKGLHG
jgi:uncharacterized membrane protein YfcA